MSSFISNLLCEQKQKAFTGFRKSINSLSKICSGNDHQKKNLTRSAETGARSEFRYVYNFYSKLLPRLTVNTSSYNRKGTPGN